MMKQYNISHNDYRFECGQESGRRINKKKENEKEKEKENLRVGLVGA